MRGMIKNRETILDEGLVLLFLVALLGYMPTARGSDRYVWAGTLALLLLRTIWLAANREITFPMDVNLFIYILLHLWGLVSCFWSVNLQSFSDYTMTSFPVVLCAVVCLCAYIGRRIEPNRFLSLLIIAGVIAGLRYCYYTDWTTLSTDYYMRGSFGRLLDDVTNYNSYTMAISTSCVLAFYYAIVEHKRKAILPAVLLMGILLIGGSRKNIIAMPLVALIFALFTGDGIKKLKMLVILLLILAVGLYMLQTVPALAQIQSSLEGMLAGFGLGEETEVDISTEGRMTLIEQGIQVWTEHPVTGVGWNNYRFYNTERLYAHNNYVEMLASLGIVGFLLYYAMFIRVGYLLCSAFWHRRVRKEDILLLGFSMSNLIMEFGSITLYFKERVIWVLILLYWHSYVTGRKTYQFDLK